MIIRDVFDLGPLVVDEKLTTRAEKNERAYMQKCMDKARNINRAKQRDKKTF